MTATEQPIPIYANHLPRASRWQRHKWTIEKYVVKLRFEYGFLIVIASSHILESSVKILLLHFLNKISAHIICRMLQVLLQLYTSIIHTLTLFICIIFLSLALFLLPVITPPGLFCHIYLCSRLHVWKNICRRSVLFSQTIN